MHIAIKIPDRRGQSAAQAIISVRSRLPIGAVKAITRDRRNRFACWREIENALHCHMYFAVPCCARQKGTNENPPTDSSENCIPEPELCPVPVPLPCKSNRRCSTPEPKKLYNFKKLMICLSSISFCVAPDLTIPPMPSSKTDKFFYFAQQWSPKFLQANATYTHRLCISYRCKNAIKEF